MICFRLRLGLVRLGEGYFVVLTCESQCGSPCHEPSKCPASTHTPVITNTGLGLRRLGYARLR